MKRIVTFLAALAPMAAAAQGLLGPPSFGDALRTLDRLADRDRGLDQTFVVPERAGKNQVAWYRFDWQYIDVPAPGGAKSGIRLYYYRNEVEQARRALPAVQSAYARLVDQFHYSPTKRIPYILYATQREFQTQNVFAVTESVLGVTSPEDLKMTVPYFGDHEKFVEVSTHEMVHQFTIQKLRDQAGSGDPSGAINLLPLWFIEGIAEYYSKGGIDTETDLFLRDLVWNPDPEKHYDVVAFADDRLRGYIPTYKLGQARCAFIADVYGKEKIQGFLENAYLLVDADPRAGSPTRSFGALVRRVLNEPLEQVDARWRSWLKRRYYPEYIRARQDLPQLREIRGIPGEPETFSASPDGNLLVVRSIDRQRGRARLLLLDLRNPRGAVEIASDGRPGTESLHPIEYGIAAVAPGVAVFSAQEGIGDRVYVQRFTETPPGSAASANAPPRISLGRRRALDLRPPGGGQFIQVADPAISPDGKQIAFVGVATGDGQQDVFVAPIEGGVARRLTNDPYAERDLAWSRDGITCASDATDHGRTNLFRIDPRTGERTRLTTAPFSDRHPAPQADGSVLFTSDSGGKLDVYSLRQGRIQQITDFTTGLTNPTLAPKGRGVLATTFYGGTFRLVELPKALWLESASAPVAPPAGGVLEIPVADFPADATDYDALSIRNWRPEAGFVYGGGAGNAVAGRAAVLFDDMLRDHVVFVDLAVLGSFDYTQGLVLYENRAHRLGWTLGAFHFVQQNIDQLDENLAYYQRDFGVVGGLRWPLDRFRRVELELTVSGVERTCLEDYSPENLTLSCSGIALATSVYPTTADWTRRNGGVNLSLSPALRFGYDTIRYDPLTGPLAGRSLVVEVGGGWLPGRQAVHGFSRFDAQQYFQLARRANIGFRASAGTSIAPDERSRVWQRTWWISSADNLRGFWWSDIENLIGRSYYVANAELQVPLDPLIHLLIFDYIEGIAALDFGGVFDRLDTATAPIDPASGKPRPLRRQELGAWDVRTLTGVLGVNVLFGPLLLRVHFGHPFDIGGLETRRIFDRYDPTTGLPLDRPAMPEGRWVTNVTLRYFFF